MESVRVGKIEGETCAFPLI
uniref:Uncharacterized protein n=1 Tax=Arundo donax TaxID=35708 RepID=A0A0A8YPS5_ARUDO